MPDHEQLGILAILGLLAVLYVIGLVIKYVTEYWYVVVPTVIGLIWLRVWWRRHHPVYLSDDEDDYMEPVPQE